MEDPRFQDQPPQQEFGLGDIGENTKIKFAPWAPTMFRSMWGRGGERVGEGKYQVHRAAGQSSCVQFLHLLVC